MVVPALAELLYTAMRQTRWLASISCAISLSVVGCSASDLDAGVTNTAGAANFAGTAGGGNVAGSATNAGGTNDAGGANDAGASGEPPSAASVAVVQVETVTTVQSSAGSFLSPTPEQVVPDYVERNPEGTSAAAAVAEERAKIDLALLFRSADADGVSQELDAQLVASNATPWANIDHYFPHIERSPALINWRLAVSNVAAADLDSSISPEWRGWQSYRGLGVRDRTRPTELSVPVATLDFEASGLSSPLLLTVENGSLTVTNRSSHVIARALLIYSHPGGVGVTVIGTLNPGERTITLLGPKENPPETLLARARTQLTEFLADSVGTELASAIAVAKSIPFLETQGLRLITLLSDELEPVVISFSSQLVSQQRVIISHSEILKPEEEARVLGVVTDPSVGAEQALATFGRFTQAKLEFAEQSTNPDVSAKAGSLLAELRAR
jgi:hypothetical protein